HIVALHNFYGEFMGTRISRKHTGWFLDALPEDTPGPIAVWKKQFNAVAEPDGQLELLARIESALSAQDKGVYPGGLAA
ncbi:MAG: tRNA dihydrouridine synthase DusB, partial [Luminiphilus sp.]